MHAAGDDEAASTAKGICVEAQEQLIRGSTPLGPAEIGHGSQVSTFDQSLGEVDVHQQTGSKNIDDGTAVPSVTNTWDSSAGRVTSEKEPQSPEVTAEILLKLDRDTSQSNSSTATVDLHDDAHTGAVSDRRATTFSAKSSSFNAPEQLGWDQSSTQLGEQTTGQPGNTTGGQIKDDAPAASPLVITDPLATIASTFVGGALTAIGKVFLGDAAPTDAHNEQKEQSTPSGENGTLGETTSGAVKRKSRMARSDLERLAAMRSRERGVSGRRTSSSSYGPGSRTASSPVLESLRAEQREKALRQAQKDAQVAMSAIMRQLPGLRDIEPHVLLKLWDAAGGNADAMLVELAKHSSSSTSKGKCCAIGIFFVCSTETQCASYCWLHMTRLNARLRWLACQRITVLFPKSVVSPMRLNKHCHGLYC
jgi:hypothetical protein